MTSAPATPVVADLVNSDPGLAANLASAFSLPASDWWHGTLHPAYTESVGDGAFDISIHLPTIDPDFRDSAISAAERAGQNYERPIICLTGADYNVRFTDGVQTWVISTRGTATDFEHDRCTYAEFTVGMMHLTQSAYGRSVYVGVLLDALAWPLGMDPVKQSDRDTTARTCEAASCAGPHPLAAYRPPVMDSLFARDTTPLVSVVVTPRGWHARAYA